MAAVAVSVGVAPLSLAWDQFFYIQELVSWNPKFTVARAGSLRRCHKGISRASLQFSPKQTLYDFVSNWSSFRFTCHWYGSLLSIKWCVCLKLLWYWNWRSVRSMLPFYYCSWGTLDILIHGVFYLLSQQKQGGIFAAKGQLSLVEKLQINGLQFQTILKINTSQLKFTFQWHHWW